MRESIKVLHSLGYNKELIEKILTTYPIYNLKDETLALKIKRIYNFLLGLGYTKEEVVKMTKQHPSLYGLSEENIKEKIEYLRSVDLEFIVIEDTKKLMQSTKLTYARYEFLTKEKKIKIDEINFRKLFYDQKTFKKQYGITNKELFETYNFENYKLNCIKK